MRIPDEVNPFKEGDIVTVKSDPSLGSGVVCFISESSVYYEARPIASYRAYSIHVNFETHKEYFKIKDLELAS
tara:strand:- start:1476 stop:1694 length:219 start_codon:yes stop_codon:yes gene_type:complete